MFFPTFCRNILKKEFQLNKKNNFPLKFSFSFFSIRRLTIQIEGKEGRIIEEDEELEEVEEEEEEGGEGDGKEDDEFLFPIQFINHSKINYYWSGREVTKIFNLSSNKFNSEKNIIYNKRNLKVVNVNHLEEGRITFTLLKDQFNLWKICNIFKFGIEQQQQSHYYQQQQQKQEEKTFNSNNNIILSNFLNEINLITNQSSLASPYQFISSPYAFKLNETISYYIKKPNNNHLFEYFDTTYKVIFSSKDQMLIETSIILKNKDEIVISLFDLLLMVVNVNTSKEQIACVMIGGEKLIQNKNNQSSDSRNNENNNNK